MPSPVADSFSSLLTDALLAAVARPEGLPLQSSKAEVGLFPAGSRAKLFAQKALLEGYFQPWGRDSDRYCATEIGRTFLIETASPKTVLEDFVRVLEARAADLLEWQTAARRLAGAVEAMKSTVGALLPRVQQSRGSTFPDIAEMILNQLKSWSHGESLQRDCPLPELFRSLQPLPSIGQFHDALRKLIDDGRIELHPWTGPLYALPEPDLALMVGHEIAGYAALRSPNRLPAFSSVSRSESSP